MSKKNFISLVLGTIGGILFALGMCMALLPEWNAMKPGIVLGLTGLVVLLILVMIRRKLAGKPVIVKLSARTVGLTLYALVSTLAFGVGMCMVMVWEMLVPGILLGLAGMVLLLGLIPLVKGLH